MPKDKKNKRPLIYMIVSVGSSFTNWIRVLSHNRFKIGFRYIPRVILVTFISLLLAPFRVVERIIYSKRIKNHPTPTPVFIIGHMRSGTTFLHHLMSQDKRFGFINTTQAVFPLNYLTLSYPLKQLVRIAMPQKRPMDNMKVNESWPQEEEFAVANISPYSPYNGAYFPENLEEFYNKYAIFENNDQKVLKEWKKKYFYLFKKLSFATGKSMILSKSLVNSSRIRQLLELFPDARFVFIYRNPYKVFLSTKKLYRKFILKHMNYNNIDDEQLENTILKLAHTGFNRYFIDKEIVPKNRLTEVKFEELVANPIEEIERIYKDIDLDGFEEIKDDIKHLIDLNYSGYQSQKYDIDRKVIDKVNKGLGNVIEKLGYEKQ